MIRQRIMQANSFRSARRCAGPRGTMERGHLALVEGGTPSFPALSHARAWFFFFPTMRAMRRTAPVFLAVLCFGCSEEPPPAPLSVELTVAIAATEEIDPAANVYLSVHHAWSGAGELRYPMEIVDRWETNLGSSSFSFDYPVDGGEGLVVYAWVDSDGDGINCTPMNRGDLADLVEIEEFPSEQVSASLFLEIPCAGPDWFFPGSEPAKAAITGPGTVCDGESLPKGKVVAAMLPIRLSSNIASSQPWRLPAFLAAIDSSNCGRAVHSRRRALVAGPVVRGFEKSASSSSSPPGFGCAVAKAFFQLPNRLWKSGQSRKPSR